MLRLDPGHPPLWRTATSLQFGLDPVAVVEAPEPWQERLVHELARGVPEGALDQIAELLGAPTGAAAELVRMLRPALVGPVPRPPVAELRVPDGFPRAQASVFERALSATHCEVRVRRAGRPATAVPHRTVVLLAHHLVVPRAAADLMARDIAHLPVVFEGARTVVGPLVVPGRTACLACQAAAQRDRDPAWPLVAAQLVGRAPLDVDDATLWDAGLTAGRLLSAVRAGADSISVVLHAGSLQRTHLRHQPHEGCLCRSPGGSGSAADHGGRAPTTGAASGPPA